MTTQPEALRLADAIDPLTRRNLDNLTCAAAAAELRRQHEEIDQWRVAVTNAERERDIAGSQRDQLLEALKELTGHANERFTGGVWDRARAAIKAVEEGK